MTDSEQIKEEIHVVFYYIALDLKRCPAALLPELLQCLPQPQRTTDLMVWDAMSPLDLEDILTILKNQTEDTHYYLGVEDGLLAMHMHRESDPTIMLAPWLIGTYRESGLWLSHAKEKTSNGD